MLPHYSGPQKTQPYGVGGDNGGNDAYDYNASYFQTNDHHHNINISSQAPQSQQSPPPSSPPCLESVEEAWPGPMSPICLYEECVTSGDMVNNDQPQQQQQHEYNLPPLSNPTNPMASNDHDGGGNCVKRSRKECGTGVPKSRKTAVRRPRNGAKRSAANTTTATGAFGCCDNYTLPYPPPDWFDCGNSGGGSGGFGGSSGLLHEEGGSGSGLYNNNYQQCSIIMPQQPPTQQQQPFHEQSGNFTADALSHQQMLTSAWQQLALAQQQYQQQLTIGIGGGGTGLQQITQHMQQQQQQMHMMLSMIMMMQQQQQYQYQYQQLPLLMPSPTTTPQPPQPQSPLLLSPPLSSLLTYRGGGGDGSASVTSSSGCRGNSGGSCRKRSRRSTTTNSTATAAAAATNVAVDTLKLPTHETHTGVVVAMVSDMDVCGDIGDEQAAAAAATDTTELMAVCGGVDDEHEATTMIAIDASSSDGVPCSPEINNNIVTHIMTVANNHRAVALINSIMCVLPHAFIGMHVRLSLVDINTPHSNNNNNGNWFTIKEVEHDSVTSSNGGGGSGGGVTRALKTNKRDNLLTWLLSRALYFQTVEYTWRMAAVALAANEVEPLHSFHHQCSSKTFVDALLAMEMGGNVDVVDDDDKDEKNDDGIAMAHTRLCVNADDVRNVILMRCFEIYLGSAFRNVFGSAAAYHTGGGGGDDGACKFWLKDTNNANNSNNTTIDSGNFGGSSGGMARQNWTVVETLFHNCCSL